MSVSRRPLLIAGLFAAGSAPLLLTLALQGSPAPAALQSQRQVADDLDKIIHPRFQADLGNFGMSRVTTITGHEPVARFDALTLPETLLLGQAQAARRDYVLAFLHCAHLPGRPFSANTFGGPRPSFSTSLSLLDVRQKAAMSGNASTLPSWRLDTGDHYYGDLRQTLQTPAVAALAQLQKHPTAQAHCDHWTLFLRPVRASKDSCLTCHTGAKVGDTLGVMVYAVSDTQNKL